MIESQFLISLILAIIQGITEWLPISSSGHLVLFENLLNYKNSGLVFEVALHFGTLMAVFVYFGKDIVNILQDFLSFKWKTENGKLALFLIIASIPAVILGFFAAKFFDSILTDLRIVAFGFAITGMLLLIASFSKIKNKKLNSKNSFLIGIAQSLALIPGISRAGSTISSGVMLGLSEKNAMRFSFLMSIPIIFGASILSLGNQKIPSELIWASLVSFLIGLATIHLLFKYILVKRENFRWFAIYCLLLAAGLGIWLILN